MLRDPAIRLLMVVAAGAVLAIAAANIIIKASLPPIPTVMILMTITLLVAAAAWRCLPKGQGQSKQDEREQRPATSLPAPTRTRTLAELLFLATDPMSIAGPASEWNTITHQKPVRGPAGVAPTLLRDASGQSYIQVRTPPEDPETLLTLRIPLSPMKLRLALTGRRPLKELAKEADWLLLTEQANNEDHPVNTLMVKGPLLLDNPKVAHLLPEDLCLSEPYETSQGWMLFTDDDLPPIRTTPPSKGTNSSPISGHPSLPDPSNPAWTTPPTTSFSVPYGRWEKTKSSPGWRRPAPTPTSAPSR